MVILSIGTVHHDTMETATTGTPAGNPNPFTMTALLYVLLGLLAALQAGLVDFGLLKTPINLSWVRIHLITLGILTQLVFGVAPRLLSLDQPPRWDIWALLNTGTLTFFYGRSIIDYDIMLTGGVLVLLATILLLVQILGAKDVLKYYYASGLVFLSIGITIGVGIWLGWKEFLGVGNMLEVHIHANNWGFMSMVFTAIVFGIYPKVFAREIQWKGSVLPILGLETLGAIGLVFGPWIGNIPVIVAGMLFFAVATVWLLLDIILPLRGEAKSVGFYHFLVAYVWIFAPLTIAPFVIFTVPGFELVEPNAPQALIYGWVLQAGMALVPYFLAQHLGKKPRLGGSWISLLLINLGAVLLWTAIFSGSLFSVLSGIAYMLWTAAFVPMIHELWTIVRE